MDNRELENILSDHADRLNAGQVNSGHLLDIHPDYAAELAPLFQLAEAVKAALVPVYAPAFKDRLRDELAQVEPTEPIVIGPISRHRMIWLTVAAGGSLLSVTGLVVLLVRRLRHGAARRAQPATTGA